MEALLAWKFADKRESEQLPPGAASQAKKIPGHIRSVLNVQEMMARALLVDIPALKAAQNAGDVLVANEILMDVFYTDVRKDLASWRESRGLPARPLAAFAESGYEHKITAARLGGAQAGWGA